MRSTLYGVTQFNLRFKIRMRTAMRTARGEDCPVRFSTYICSYLHQLTRTSHNRDTISLSNTDTKDRDRFGIMCVPMYQQNKPDTLSLVEHQHRALHLHRPAHRFHLCVPLLATVAVRCCRLSVRIRVVITHSITHITRIQMKSVDE